MGLEGGHWPHFKPVGGGGQVPLVPDWYPLASATHATVCMCGSNIENGAKFHYNFNTGSWR